MRILLFTLLVFLLPGFSIAGNLTNLNKMTSPTSGEFGLKWVHVYNKTSTSFSYKENFEGIGVYLGKGIIDIPGLQSYVGLEYNNLWMGKESRTIDQYIYKTSSNANTLGTYLKFSVGNKFRIFGIASIGVITFNGKYISKLRPAYAKESIFWDDRQVKSLVTSAELYKGLGFGLRYSWFELSFSNQSINPTRMLDPESIDMDKMGNLNNYGTIISPNNIWMISFTFSPIIN